MKYRIFGKTGWKVSEIGFGGWQLGDNFGALDEKEALNTLWHAWEQGINFVDTAQMYGNGKSEERIGKALKQWKGNHIYIASKVQPTAWPKPSDPDPDIEGLYRPDYLREQCEASLQRLGVEAIDLYQLHGWFPSGVQHTEWYEGLRQLKEEGKIREIGVSIRDYRPEDGIDIAQTGKIASEQVVFNLFEQRPVEQLLPVCHEHEVAFIARVPFDESALVGNWTAHTYDSWENNDVRKVYFKGERFRKTLDKVEALKETVKAHAGDRRYGMLAEVALRFCLSHPEVNVVIPGMKNKEEVNKNIAVSDGEILSDSLLQALKKFRWPRNYHNPEEV